MIKAIWAMDKNGLIGKKDGLPWRNRDEMLHFKNSVKDKTLLFGDKTYFSTTGNFGDSKIYIITNNKNLKIENKNITIIYNLFEFLENYPKTHSDDLYVCGGKSVYEQSIKYVDEIFVTIMKQVYEGDVYINTKIMDDFEIVNTTEFTDFSVVQAKRKNK